MKKSEIIVGGHYIARVSNKFVTVRVDTIRETDTYVVTNLTTGRKTTFRSIDPPYLIGLRDGPLGGLA